MHAELKKDDVSMQKQSSDRHRDSRSSVDQNPDLLSGESTEGFKSSPSHTLPPTGQGQLPMQCKGLSESSEPTHKSGQLIQRRVNNTGLPDKLKNGIENLSGISMDDVSVHYNSGKPAQQQAHAYTQGSAIHVAPGQEQHLPHEAWHVVQQKQGRVQPTVQMKGKVNVNDDAGLEKEADVMGAKALRLASSPSHRPVAEGSALQTSGNTTGSNLGTIQKKPKKIKKNGKNSPRPVIRFTENPRYKGIGNAQPQTRLRLPRLPRLSGLPRLSRLPHLPKLSRSRQLAEPQPQTPRQGLMSDAELKNKLKGQPKVYKVISKQYIAWKERKGKEESLSPEDFFLNFHLLKRLNNYIKAEQDKGEKANERKITALEEVREDVLAEKRRLKEGEKKEESNSEKNIVEDLSLWEKTVSKQDPVVKLFFLEKLLEKITKFIEDEKSKQQTDKFTEFSANKDELETELARVQKEYPDDNGQDKPPSYPPVDLPVNLDELTPPDFKADKAWKQGGQMNDVEQVTLSTKGKGTLGVFKPESEYQDFKDNRGALTGIPERDPNQTGRSIAAHRIDQLLGAGIIPATYRAEKGSDTGSVMKFIKNAETAAIPNNQVRTNLKPKHHRERSNLYLMDVITGQIDRHFGNILLQEEKVWGIDNDMAFGSRIGFDEEEGKVLVPSNAKNVWAGSQPKDLAIDKAFAIKIINLARHPEWVAKALDGLINPDEVKKTLERLKGLAAYLVRRIATNDNVKEGGDWES